VRAEHFGIRNERKERKKRKLGMKAERIREPTSRKK
jgi:hypothetical protein